MNEVLALIARLVGVDVHAGHEPPRAGDIRTSLADITAARRSLGYDATISLEDWLIRTIVARANLGDAKGDLCPVTS